MVVNKNGDQFPLRLPNGMRDAIKDAAVKNGRSMNSEIVYQLGQVFEAQPIINGKGQPVA